jgi:hypothetical protein
LQRTAELDRLAESAPQIARDVRSLIEQLDETDLVARVAPAPPSQLGPFRLLHRIGSGGMGDYAATALLRLKRNFNVDTSFGNGGKIQHTIEVSTTGQHGQSAEPILMQPGRIVVGGAVFTGLNGRMQMMMGMTHDEIFADTLE